MDSLDASPDLVLQVNTDLGLQVNTDLVLQVNTDLVLRGHWSIHQTASLFLLSILFLFMVFFASCFNIIPSCV